MDKLPPSPKMKQIFANPDITRARKHSLDFDSLAVYDTFTVGMNTIKVSVLRTTAVRAGQRLGRKFRVVTHTADNLYEIGRLPDPVAKPKAIKEEEPSEAVAVAIPEFDMDEFRSRQMPVKNPNSKAFVVVNPNEPEQTAGIQRIRPMWDRTGQ